MRTLEMRCMMMLVSGTHQSLKNMTTMKTRRALALTASSMLHAARARTSLEEEFQLACRGESQLPMFSQS